MFIVMIIQILNVIMNNESIQLNNVHCNNVKVEILITISRLVIQMHICLVSTRIGCFLVCKYKIMNILSLPKMLHTSHFSRNINK